MLWVGALVAVLLLASFYYLMFADGNPFKVHLIYYGCLLTRSPPDSLERIRDALQNNPENQVDHMAEYAALALFVPRGQFPIHRHSSSQQEAAKGLLAAWEHHQLYRCYLPVQPASDVDGRDPEPLQSDEFRVNPSFYYQPLGTWRVDSHTILQRIRTDLSADCPVCSNDFPGPLVWAERPGVKFLTPYVIPDRTGEFFDRLSPGQVITSADITTSLTLGDASEEESVVEVLRKAWIIVREGEWEDEEQRWEKTVESAREMFHRDGYVVLSDLLPYLHLDALDKHCQEIFEGYESHIDREHMTDYGACHKWKEPAATFFNVQFGHLVQLIIGEQVIPVRPITLLYPPHSLLLIHCDGAPFAYSMSLLVTHQQERHTETKHKKKEEEGCYPALAVLTSKIQPMQVDIQLQRGQAVLFKGQEHPHYRDITQEGQTLVSVSFSWDQRA